MPTQELSGDKKYICIRDGFSFYWFGDGCIADFYGNPSTYLNELDIDIILKCRNGIERSKLAEYIDVVWRDKDKISDALIRLKKKGILIERDIPRTTPCAFYGTKGKFFPQMITIEVTDSCNYACPFCYRNAMKTGRFISDEIVDQMDSIIHGNVRYVVLSGGEPTLHPHISRYIDIFSEHSNVSMISNGSVLYKLLPAVLKKLDHVQLSIYGCNDYEYMINTGVSDGFARIKKSVDILRNNDVDMVLALSLYDGNCDRLEEYVETAIELGFSRIRIGKVRAFGRGRHLEDTGKEFDVDFEVDKARKKYREQIKIDSNRINIDHVDTHEEIDRNVYRDSFNCGKGSTELVISPDGLVRPCAYLSEDIFSYKTKNALEEHINGDFHIDMLERAVWQTKQTCSCEDYCGAIEAFIKRGMEN